MKEPKFLLYDKEPRTTRDQVSYPSPTLIKNLFDWLLKKAGYKIVKLDDYKEETVKVQNDYPTKAPSCIQETKNGAKFYWSEIYHTGYEKYFELVENTRRYFQWDGHTLWIKRPSMKENT